MPRLWFFWVSALLVVSCGDAPPIAETPERGRCADGVDNDQDGQTDCSDSNCAALVACGGDGAVDDAGPRDAGASDSARDSAVEASSSDAASELGDAPLRAKRMFVTSTVVSGNAIAELGGASGLEAADRLCARMAASVPDLTGEWKALLATSRAGPSARFTSASAYTSLTGVVLFPTGDLDVFPTSTAWSALTDEESRALANDAAEAGVASFPVWTGATAFGASSDNCSDWNSNTGTGAIGNAISRASWLGNGNLECAMRAHLYCVEQ